MIVEKIEAKMLASGKAEIILTTDDKEAVQSLMDSDKPEKKYRATIKEYKEGRSRDANGYYWSLLNQIAKALSTSSAECHNIMLGRYGTLDKDNEERPICSLERDNEEYLKYETRHLFPTDATEEKKGIKYRWFIKIKGSSKYDTAEMSRLIDGIVSEAKELDIPTETPNEIERMKQQWGVT